MQVAPFWQGPDSQGSALSWHTLPRNPGAQRQKWEEPLSTQRPPFWHRAEASMPWLSAAFWQEDRGTPHRGPVQPWEHRHWKEGPLWRQWELCGQGFWAQKSTSVWQRPPV